MWIAVIGGLVDTNLFIDVDIFAIDLSTPFNCPISNINVSSDDLCDGIYHCNYYEDESTCNYSTATYLQPGESHSIDIPRNYTRRFYHATVLQTNDTNGFRIVFQDFYIRSTNQVQIGTGTDPSDPESVITTIYGYTYCCPWDVYIESNEMWIAVIGGLVDTNLFIDVDIFAIDLSTPFNCPISNINVSSDDLCDGIYHCNYYEDESTCNYSTATYLQPGESHSIDIPRNYTRRFYHATVLQTNDTNGFRIVFQDFYIRSTNQVQIGTGTDPSDPESVITTIYGYTYCCPWDVYIESNEMWIAVIGGLVDTNLFIDVDIFAIDLSTPFNCPISNINVSSDDLCDGIYHCNYYEDESTCNYIATYLQPGESHSIDIPRNYTRRFYHATVLQTNDTNGFRIVFQYLYLYSSHRIQIGTGTDPSDQQSVITTINGHITCCPVDVFVETNQMWIAVIGGLTYTNLEIDAGIVAFNLSTLFNCPRSNMNVSSDVLCDGVYHCDHYEDELACNYPATYLQSGESYSIDIPRNYTRRFYHATVLQTNDTNGFRIVIQNFYIRYTNQIQIGTGTDPSDPASVITSLFGYRSSHDDVYVETNKMWIAVIGGLADTNIFIDVDILAIDLSTPFNCPISNINVSSDDLCDGLYHCNYYEDESTCNYTATYLQPGESHSIDIPRNYTRRFYHATVLQTNDTNGFRIVFQYLYLYSSHRIQIGTGTDPSDQQSVITTINGHRTCCPVDVFVETNKMWIAVIGGLTYTNLEIDAGIVAFNLSTLFNCPRSNMNVSSDVLCDGVYHCDHYEDELACNYPATYLQSGESYSIDIPDNYTRRFYHATVLQTNDTNGFRIFFQNFYIRYTNQIQIGTGTDPSDPASVITSLFGFRSSYDDVYVETNKMWIAVIGGLADTNIFIDVDILAIDLSTPFNCSISNINISSDDLCDGLYHCSYYEDESTCNYTAMYLQSGESHSIDIPRNYTRRFYHATVLQTNDTNGFRIVFQDLYIRYTNQIQIGRGTDPSDPQSVTTSLSARSFSDDVYVETNKMWMAVIGGLYDTNLFIDVDIFAIDLSTLFSCQVSNINVSSDVLCDGVYHCDHYEDELACNYSTTYLQAGESHSISIPRNYIRRFYHATVLQTNDTNGFRIVFQDSYLYSSNQIQIGKGTDPSDPESVITTLFGSWSSFDDVYVDTDKMWMAVIGGLADTNLFIDVDIFAIDLSTLFSCPVSNMNVSSDVLCDGVYHCDHYEDESACNYTTTYLQSGESHSIDIPRCYTRRFYHATVLQTNDTNGFRIVFQYFYISYTNQVQIGTGTDPSDPESVITTIYGTTYCCPWDVYIESNEMWIGVIGGLTYTNLEIDADIVAFDLSTLLSCPVSNMNVSSDVLCDGVYNCDHYEDESACNYSTTYLQAGESHSISIPRNYIRRLYHATVLQTNDTNGFRIVFQDSYLYSSNQIQIGKGTDPSDPESVITTLFGSRSSFDDVYVDTDKMWMAVIGGLADTNLFIDVDIFAMDLSTLFSCPVSNINVSSDVLCDGVYHCDHYEDESACNYSTTYLQAGESHSISIPRNYTRRFYHATVLQTNDTNGFRIVFQDLYLYSSNQIQIGKGTDPSDPESVITTINGHRTCCPVDVYEEANELWMSVIGGLTYTDIFIDVNIIAIDLRKSFHCPVSSRNISITLACDGYYDCDYFEDELYCNNPVTHLEEGQSHSISTPSFTREFYNTTLLRANTSNGFRIVFHRLNIDSYDDEIRIGTGNDPSDLQSIVTTIHGYASYADNVYIDTHKMWVVVIGSQQYGHSSYIVLDMYVTVIDLLNSFPCSSSSMNVSVTLVCDGYYDCDNYDDESLCDHLFCPENISTIVDPFSETATVVLPSIGVGVATSPQNGSVFMQGSTPVLVTREEEQCMFYVYVEPLIQPTCEDIFQLSPLSTVVVIWFVEEPTQYSLETVVGGEMASYVPTLNIAFIEVSVPSVLECVVSITDHPDYNCSFTLSVFPYTCNVTSYPSEYLTALSATNQEFDIPPEEQCFGESMITVNTTCIFGCDVGYNLIGNESVSCIEDGLSDSLPTCDLVTCQSPTMFPSFLHTTSTINNCTEGEQIVYNTSCSYDCEVGYNLTGNSAVTCLENGELSSELPNCGIVQCFVPSFSERLISLESTCYERMYINFTDSCYFGCDVGFDLIGNGTVTCGEDALLSSELPTCQVVSCSVPVLPPSLSTMTSQCNGGLSINYTDTCSYSCDEGYNLIGSESVTCLANTSLSDFLPTCEVVSCSIPVLSPRLSTMTSQCNGGQSINYTDTCLYSCDVGYNLIGSESVTCLANTSLSDFLPICEVVTCSVPQLLPPLSKSCPMGQEVNYNTSCEFSCSPGFDIIGSTSLDCLANGTLSGDIPMCEIVLCQLPEVFHPELSSVLGNCSDGSSIDFNTTCTFECSEGYDLIGSEIVGCQSNGTLSESPPTCNVVTCSVPQLLPPLSTSCPTGQEVVYSTSCEFSCSPGFDIIGSTSLDCLVNGTLSGDIPTCEIVVCPLPEVFHPELSSIFRNCSEGSSIDFNTTCTFECSEGYDLIGNESVKCQSNGTLSESLPTCNVGTCGVPQLLPPLSTSCPMEQQVSYNTSCEFSCENGYTLQGMSPLSCLASGNFSNEIPTCQIVTCLLPETFSQELSSVDCDAGSSIDFNSLCTFECSEGHDLVGSSTITCQSNGEVSASIPTCSVVSCSIPEFPSRLSSMTSQCNDGQSINYTQTCSFSCDTGYNLVGSSSVTCLDNSSLSDSLPTCEIETCGVPQLLSPLSTSCPMGQHVRYNTSCEFSCENGYTLQGMPSLTCLASGNFSDEVPNCQIETCGVPQILPPLSTTCPMGQQVGYNTSCEFSCENGYTLQGMPSLSCLASGNFSDDFPTCNIVSCSLPEVFSEELSSSVNCDAGSTIVFNTTCSFECSIGYSLIGVENITCQTDGLLSAAVPYCNVVTCNIPMFPANLTTPNTQCGEEIMIDYNTMCMYECQQGYDLIGNASIGCQANGELSTDLPTCQVIDICQRFSPCPTVSTCNGGISTFSCSCDAGYTTDVTITSDTTTYTCVNINECNASPPVCDSNARCNDLSGSYLCTCMEGFSGNGTFCEALEPCTLSPCQNGGTCTNTDDGSSYVCTCPQSFTDVNCNTVIVEQEPLAVVTNPVSQMVDFEDRVTFSCSFQNAQSFRWFKDSAPIPNNENQSPLVINPALAEDQGYYYCSAIGEDGTTATTNQALLTVNGVDNYVVVATFLTRTFNNSLLDRTSLYFFQLSNELINFITTPLQNNFDSSVAASMNTFSSGSVVAEFGVYVYNGSVPDSEQLSIIRSTMTNLAEENPTFLDPASIQTFSAVTCPAGSYITSYGYEAVFDTGDIGSRANSTDANCPDYTINRDYRIEAICVGDTIRPCIWVPLMNCGRNLTADELLKILLQEEVTEDNAEMVVEEVAEITTMTETISTEGLEIVADFLEDIVELDTSDVKVTESFVAIANNYADVAEETRDMAEDESGASSRVVVSLETQLAVVEVQNDSLRIIEPNIAAEVLDVTANEISQGFTVYMSVTPDGDSISGDDFQVEQGDQTTQPEVLQAQATLLLPPTLGDKLTGSTGRLVITIHLDTALFRDRELTELNENQTEFGRELNSRIIGAAVDNEEIEDLEQPVVLSFTPINPNGTNATCVSYNFTEKRWSTRGCRKTSNESTDRITCECDHLTNFGILMDIYGGEGLSARADLILDIISYVGCCMSIWGLAITILTYASNKKLRDRKPNQILLSLSASLLCLYIVFLVMISVDTERGVEEIPPLPCCILAGFLHYFTLTSLFWMAVEGYNMYILFVRVLNTHFPRFLRKASLFAWGTPMLIVGITGGASRQYYVQTDFCFLRFWPLIGGLLIPIGLIMIFNFVIFVRVILRLNKTIKGKQLDKTEKRQRLRRFQNAVCILVLMGLTWAVGYLSIIQPAAEVVQGVFTILNSLQGYFIFMLYCVRQPQVRRAWRSQFSCCLPKSFGASSAFTSASGQTNSTSKNSSARLMAQRNQQNRLLANSESNGFRPETIMRTPPERLPRSAAYNNEGGDW
ncbi:uncharacterized protein LOC129271801 isoform X2 [Lytechinus pictus]|uniref:uncharacterized protein LOC129271801 isoform X2 n=1 Tax=Lytechinus pictus TaxID=7653 RepID=UPI0030BA1B67